MIGSRHVYSEVVEAIAAGEYFEALKIAPQAKKLEIDAAAARLARQYPSAESKISAVADILTHERSRCAYLKARDLRDGVLQYLRCRCGESVDQTVPDLKKQVWEHCCTLLQFTPEGSQPSIGPRGLKSLVCRGTVWVAESVLDSVTVPIRPTASEKQERTAIREIWHAVCPVCGWSQLVACRRRTAARGSDTAIETLRERAFLPCGRFDASEYDYRVAACRNCHSQGGQPSKYEGTYRFSLPALQSPGTIITGESQTRSKSMLAVIEAVSLSLPAKVLRQLYTLQQAGEDVTLDEASRRALPETTQAGTESEFSPFILVMIVVSIAIAVSIGGIADRHKKSRTSYAGHRQLQSSDYRVTGEQDAAPQTSAEEANAPGRSRAIWPWARFELELAVQAAEWSAGLDPSDVQAQEHLAMGYAMLGQHYAAEDLDDRAIEYCQKAIDLDNQLLANHPDRVECYRSLGRAHNGIAIMYLRSRSLTDSQEHLEEAVTAFDELRQRSADPSTSDVEYSLFQINLALVKTGLKQHAEALELLTSTRPRLEAALDNSPPDPQVEKFLQRLDAIEARARQTQSSTSD